MAVEKLPWLSIELDREEDGRWIAEVPELPGVICYGRTRETAISAAILLSVSVIRDTARAIAARTRGVGLLHKDLNYPKS